MKKFIFALLIFAGIGSGVFAPVIASAQTSTADCAQLEQRFKELGGSSSAEAQSFLKKFPKQCTAGNVVNKVITLALGLAAIVAVIAMMYGGFLMITSAGNEETFGKGKKTLVFAALGLVVIIAAGAIVAFIINFVNK
jgi:hypothetical protein